MADETVRVRNAPGLTWKKRPNFNEARWQARQSSIERGFKVKSVKLWSGAGEPTKKEWDYIVAVCNQLQQELLVFDKGFVPPTLVFDGTLRGLMEAYRRDPDSTYRKLRYKTRTHYDFLIDAIDKQYGGEWLTEIKGRTLLRWHEGWTAKDTTITIAHNKVGLLRTVFRFGRTILENPECERVASILSGMKFKMPKAREERVTAEQANAIRGMAHKKGRPSIAVAQAFQFECILRQKDVIGEWVPMAEPGASDVTFISAEDGIYEKWLRGLRWNEIDENLILRHNTSKKEKDIVLNLKLAPMVMEELKLLGYNGDRASLPAAGPVIVSEWSGIPWTAVEYRRWWRILANACGIPKTVKNMDSRAGGISEATDAGLGLELVRHAATHSNVATTARYSRGTEEKVARVMQIRAEHRTKNER